MAKFATIQKKNKSLGRNDAHFPTVSFLSRQIAQYGILTSSLQHRVIILMCS